MRYSLVSIIILALSVQQVVATPLKRLVKRQQIDGLCSASFNLYDLPYFL
jgi:hypothetical protein